jgi:DNA polymerase sigma
MNKKFITIDGIQYNIEYCKHLTKEAFLKLGSHAKESHYKAIKKLMENDNKRENTAVEIPEHPSDSKQNNRPKKRSDNKNNANPVGAAAHYGEQPDNREV